ncbi:hypothetical protein Q9L58_008264 [Maublancomyces gigas]|uniref:Carbonic anhydrase n=1 Tax=Discina gigas TaxID=1032678 RepID=A0ABR3GAJ7_9PEZI
MFYPEESFAGANAEYFKVFPEAQAGLPLPPAKHYAIVTCMDARIDAFKAFGLSPGDAHVIRNAGGSARDAIRSLVISQQMLGTNAIYLVKHTKCGMATFENKDIHRAIAENLGVGAKHIDFLPFSDVEKAVKEDIAFLKGHELVHPRVKSHISGWIYDVDTGKVKRIV